MTRPPIWFVLFLAGCGPRAAAPSPGGTVTVTDLAGVEVAVPAAPGRIVSAAPACTEILFAVGAGDAVVGVTDFCTFPPEARTRSKIGQFGPDTISLEAVLGLRPDLVFAAPGWQDSFIEAVRRRGIPVVGVEARSFAEVYRAVCVVGTATGHDAEGKALSARLRDRVERVAARPIARRPRVFYLLDDTSLFTVGPKTFVGEMIRLAGGDNVFDDVDQIYPKVSEEELIRRNPEVIVVPRGRGHSADVDSLLARPAWQTMAAVKGRRVIRLDQDAASRAGPRLADALEQLADELRGQK